MQFEFEFEFEFEIEGLRCCARRRDEVYLGWERECGFCAFNWGFSMFKIWYDVVLRSA